jgi:hypothetical protein
LNRFYRNLIKFNGFYWFKAKMAEIWLDFNFEANNLKMGLIEVKNLTFQALIRLERFDYNKKTDL